MRALRTALAILLVLGGLLFTAWLANSIPVDHWGFAVSVNFLFMALFTFVFDRLLNPDFTSGYFDSRPFEQDGSIYRWCGLRHYASLLRLIGWERIRRTDQPITSEIESLRGFERWTRGAESVHALSAIVVAAITISIRLIRSSSDIKWLVLSNVLFNVYPVMLQRYNRARIERILGRADRAQDRGDSERS
jgi:hypothetical protein